MVHRVRSTTLFCFPCAGASAMVYARWCLRLPSWIVVRPVELPGRGARMSETPVTDYETLVALLTEELAGELPADYALFGHSMGGLLAYGCAHSFAQIGAPSPRALLVAGCSAPSRRDIERFERLQSDAQLVDALRDLDGTPREVFEHEELLAMTLRIMRADCAVCASFRAAARGPLRSRLFVFGGRDDDISLEDLAAWESETSARTTVDMFEGGHFFLRENEEAFLAALERKLAG